MSVIHFNGIDSQEFNEIMSRYRVDYGEKFTFVEDGQTVVEMEGYRVGVSKSLKQLYSKKIVSFPNFSQEDRKIFLPIVFLTHGDVDENAFDHLAMMYVDVDSGIVHYFCQLRGDIYEKAAKTNIMVRLRAQYPGVRLKYKKHRFSNVINQYYPDSCALFAIWIMQKIVNQDGQDLNSIRLPSFAQMHSFRKKLNLEQDRQVTKRKHRATATLKPATPKSRTNGYLLQNILSRNLREGRNDDENYTPEESSQCRGAKRVKLTIGDSQPFSNSSDIRFPISTSLTTVGTDCGVLKDATNKECRRTLS